MGESPDRSIRTAGAEKQEAERTPVEAAEPTDAVDPADPVEPAEPAGPTDSPTRTLRPREREAAEAGAEAEDAAAESTETADGTGAEAESPVESATRVLRAPAPAAAAARAEEQSKEDSAADEGATRVLRVLEPAVAAGKAEAAEEEPGEDSAGDVGATRVLVPAADAQASDAATDTAEEPGAEPESEPEADADVESGVRSEPESVAKPDPRVPASAEPEPGPADAAGESAEPEPEADAEADAAGEPAETETETETEPEADAAGEPEEPEAVEETEEVAESAQSAAVAAEGDEPEATDEPEPTPGPTPTPAPDRAPRGGGGFADAETRAMSVLPPIPPPPAPPRPVAGAPAGAPARGLPVGATAVADSPETTVEAMEVLAGLSARPMTPMRVALRRVRLWGTLLVLLVLILGTVQLVRPLPSPKLAQSAATGYSFQGGTLALDWPVKGQAAVAVPGLGLMGQSGSGNPVPLASVTKMMTAYIVLRDHPLKKGEPGPTITVDQGAVNDYNTGKPAGESVQKVALGEKLSEYQALQMLLLPSANNVARLLGRWDAGTDAAFVQKMQATAAQLGMTQSTYTDPSGLDATTRSTAADQLKLEAAAMADPVFREVVGTQQFDSPLNGLTANTNTLVGKNGVIGIKTGSSTAALGNLVWAAEQNVGGVPQLIIGVTLSQPAVGSGPGQGILDQALANSKKLILSAESALQGHTIAHKGDVVGYVDDGLGGRTPVVATEDVQVTGWSGLSVGVSLRPVGGKGISHAAAAGTVVGELVVGSGASAQTIPVALQSDLAAPGFGAKLTRLA